MTRANPTVGLVLGTSTGGVGTHVSALTRGLIGAGWRVRVCGPPATDELFGFSATGAGFTPLRVTGAAGELIALAGLHRASRAWAITHAHGLRAGLAAALAAVGPTVVTWHNAVLAEPGARRAVLRAGERIVARRADITLAASSDLAARVRELGGTDVRDAPVAVTPGPATRSVEAVRAELGLSAHHQLVVSIGRLHPQKGHDVLVEAAARWSPADVLVAIAGDGPQREALSRQIASLGAPVRLLGRRADVGDLLAAADVVVLASRWEARALAAQEALMAGRPLVATAVGGLPALVGPSAVLVAADDVDALDRAVRELLGDPRRRTELAERGRARSATWPTEDDTLAQVIAVYRELLGISG
jgi:glycosyltransferase involved in cell wall biosynthesis